MNRTVLHSHMTLRKGGATTAARTALATACLAALAACTTVVQAPPPRMVHPVAAPVAVYVEPQPVISVYIDPPVEQPPPVFIGWAPPPMLVDAPPSMPFADAVWVGGYWGWQGRWVWAAGRWIAPPQPNLLWVQPYYENRGSAVVFVTGYWGRVGVAFVPPPPSPNIVFSATVVGVVRGPEPIGPMGVFVPAPPGSRPGIIVPAPIGTAPAVVTGAPPVVAVGMHIINQSNVGNTTVVNNRVSHVTNVIVVAPATATASGRAFESAEPAQAHLAAARPAVVRAVAPVPSSTQPIPAYLPGRPLAALPPAQTLRPVVAAPSLHPAAETVKPAAVGAKPVPVPDATAKPAVVPRSRSQPGEAAAQAKAASAAAAAKKAQAAQAAKEAKEAKAAKAAEEARKREKHEKGEPER